MKKLLALLALLVPVSALAQTLEPYRHNFFTTNPAPVVEVVAGTNVTVQYTTVSTHTRRYTVNSSGAAATNVYYSAAGTNIIINTNGYLYTINLDTSITNGWASSNDLYTASNTVAGLASGVTNGWPWTNLTVIHAGAVTNGYPWTNLTVVHASAVTNGYPWMSNASFGDFALSGTNVVISPTNGNLQSWVLTNASWAALDTANTNFTETIRLNLYVSNTLTWTTANLSNSVNLGPSNAISVMLFDHCRDTNLWWGYRLR